MLFINSDITAKCFAIVMLIYSFLKRHKPIMRATVNIENQISLLASRFAFHGGK